MSHLIEPPVFWDGPVGEHVRKVVFAVKGIMAGKLNNVFEVVLKPDATETIVERERVTQFTKVMMTPATASAAAATPYVWVETNTGKITVHHDSQSDTDRKFSAAVFG